MLTTEELILRLVIAAGLGGAIGFEREINNRPAGLRTHILVCLGSCLVMILSTEAFGDSGDPARLAAQVVSGIGFLGAGTILRDGLNVRGLTTAATLWVSAGVGLATGVGYYIAAITTTVLVLFFLVFLRFLERRMKKLKRFSHMKIFAIERAGLIGEIGTSLGEHNIVIKNVSIESEAVDEDEVGNVQISFHIKIPGKLNLIPLYDTLSKVQGIDYVVWDEIIVIRDNKLCI
ncbi:MAG: MgtC/SapB family protein [Alkaliphilus sp.]